MSFKIPNFVNRGSVRWIVLAVFLFGTIFGAAGIAAAQLDGTETVYYDETTAIDNSTTELEVTVNGTNSSDVFVNYYRIANDANSTETLESEGMILNSATGNETTASWPVQTNETSAYRVVVHDNGNGLSASEVGNITVTPLAVGGFGFGGDSGNAPIIGIIAVVALALVVRMRE
jgi:type II secretory pathway pseudopilin PulG